MATIKKSELKRLNSQQLSERLMELKKELIKANTKRASKTSLENPCQFRELRRSIARILTIMNQNKNKKTGGS